MVTENIKQWIVIESEKWRKRYNKLHDLYSSPNIVRVIKPRRMRWAGQVAPMGEVRGVFRVLVGKPEGETTGETQS
jgi:hypothetical protein